MRSRSRVITFLVCLTVALGSGVPAAQAQDTDRPIVLAQQERPSIFRHLFKRRAREAPGTPRIERQVQPRQQELRRPSLPEPELARPQRKKKATARPAKKREAARPAKREAAPRAAKPREQQTKRRKERRIGAAAAAAAAPKPVQAVEKAADARKVLVLGDFMAGQLAKGLTETYAENAAVVVVDANRGDSGLVRTDLYDWPLEIPGLVTQHNPAAVVMMVGANDRQSIAAATGSAEIGSEAWRGAYGARVSALATALKATGKPVLWMGLAPVRPGQMSRDYSAMNGVVREQVERAGLRFVDSWNGFADEEGKFIRTGPDITGRQVQLRSKDGLNFTKSGQRKLAFFLEGDLNAVLGGGPAVAGAPQVAALEALSGPPPELVREGAPVPTIGPMVPIEALTTGGDALSGEATAAAQSGAASDAVLHRLAADGNSAPPGRADNFAQITAAAASPVPTADAAPGASAQVPAPPEPPPVQPGIPPAGAVPPSPPPAL